MKVMKAMKAMKTFVLTYLVVHFTFIQYDLYDELDEKAQRLDLRPGRRRLRRLQPRLGGKRRQRRATVHHRGALGVRLD
eukprot:16199412-Heterocapsa_arctica.AAC.1